MQETKLNKIPLIVKISLVHLVFVSEVVAQFPYYGGGFSLERALRKGVHQICLGDSFRIFPCVNSYIKFDISHRCRKNVKEHMLIVMIVNVSLFDDLF